MIQQFVLIGRWRMNDSAVCSYRQMEDEILRAFLIIGRWRMNDSAFCSYRHIE